MDVHCYRIYDMDIPEFPFCIDRYGEYLHVSEYKVRHQMTEEEHAAWLKQCMDVVCMTLQVAEDQLFLKERRRLSRRTEQYEKVSEEHQKIVVEECGLKFQINLTDYLDTGLFLDHRPLRQIFKEEARGKNVLNLFAYTGSFSVYAASGGAGRITTVDLSNTYLQWSKDNFLLNNLPIEGNHTFIQSDVMSFLKETTEEYDLVLADPPAFSNSKRLKGTWDTQRDHRAMLRLILTRMRPGGIIYFSNNLRNFIPNLDHLPVRAIEDISLQTIPEDFRNKQIHHCYRIVCR